MVEIWYSGAMNDTIWINTVMWKEMNDKDSEDSHDDEDDEDHDNEDGVWLNLTSPIPKGMLATAMKEQSLS